MSGQVTLSQTAFDELMKEVKKVGKLEEQLVSNHQFFTFL